MDIPEIDWESSGLPYHFSVVVPHTACPLTDGQLAALRAAIQPTAASESYGSTIYIAAVQFCEQLLDC